MTSNEMAKRAGASKKGGAVQGPHATDVAGSEPDYGAIRPGGSANQRMPKPAPVGPAESKTAITTPDERGGARPGKQPKMATPVMKTTKANPARKI